MTVLTLQDLSGRIYKEIYRGYAEAGEHNFQIDLKELSTGMYAIILLTNEHFIGRKLIKAKK
jgi:hypothetical protein